MTSCLEGLPSGQASIATMNRSIVLQHVGSCLIDLSINGTSIDINVGLLDKVLLLALRQLVPVPPSNDVVQMVDSTLVIDGNTISCNLLCLITVIICIIGIETRLYVEQLQFSIRTSSNSKRNLHLLSVSRC